jgi:selenocysteine-specific translation elongation factor
MRYLVAAVPNDPELASWLGKKGSVNGITFYNRREGETVLTILAPSNLEEKFYAIGEILTVCDVAVISTKNLDSTFGEAVIAASLLKKRVLITKENDVSGIVGKLGLDYELVEKEDILQKLDTIAQSKSASGDPVIDVDKSFPVKGVGTVLLGIALSGVIKKHDELVTQHGKRLQVRSIQVQDEDCDSATAGARVGLAVKGIDEKEVEKGEVLAKERIMAIEEVSARLSFNPLGGDFSEETQYTLVSGFGIAPCKILKDGDSYRIKLGKPTQIRSSGFVILRDKKPKVLCAGILK